MFEEFSQSSTLTSFELSPDELLYGFHFVSTTIMDYDSNEDQTSQAGPWAVVEQHYSSIEAQKSDFKGAVCKIVVKTGTAL